MMPALYVIEDARLGIIYARELSGDKQMRLQKGEWIVDTGGSAIKAALCITN